MAGTVAPKVGALSLFDDEDERIGGMSEAQLLAEAERLKSRLARVLRILRAKKGGAATKGKPRRRRASDDRIVEVYRRQCDSGLHGALKRTWLELGLSERHVSRRLRARGWTGKRLSPPGNPTGFSRKGEKLRDQAPSPPSSSAISGDDAL